MIDISIDQGVNILLNLNFCVLMGEEVMMGEKNVPVVLPNLDITLNIDVVVEATVNKIFAATKCKLNTI